MREQGRGTSEDLQIPKPPSKQPLMRSAQGWRPAPRRTEFLMMAMLIGATIVILLAGAVLALIFIAATMAWHG